MRRHVQWLNSVRTPDAIRAAAFIDSPIAHPSAAFRRAAYDALGGYRDDGGPEDYDHWLRLLVRAHRIAKVAEVLLSWRDAPNRLSRVDAPYNRRRFFAIKLRQFCAAVPPGTTLQIWGAGRTGRRWARALCGSGYAVARFVDIDPRRWGQFIHGVPVHPPGSPQRADGFVLAAAGSPGARESIEHCLQSGGLRPWFDYLAVV